MIGPINLDPHIPLCIQEQIYFIRESRSRSGNGREVSAAVKTALQLRQNSS